MMHSQRMIKKEFGVRIELDDDQVMARVFAYAAQSTSGDLKQCANELMQQLLPGEGATQEAEVDSPATSAARIYRGQVMPAKAAAEAGSQPEAAAAGSGKKVIYRGRRVG